MNYQSFFCTARADHREPLPYQARLATGDWPDLLVVPTGLGKTAAVVLAWLYRVWSGDPATPRRLVYCLPMRVLVEQVQQEAEQWLERLGPLFDDVGRPQPGVHVLLGGAADEAWVNDPARPAIIVGTQDMLLSRALMRGYGMSRYRWPIDFALLHNDALWVFDEVQLMGAGLPTSTQLEGFRRAFGSGRACRSLWMSATLRPDWLGSVDFRRHIAAGGLHVETLSEAETRLDTVRERREAVKHLARAGTRLTGLSRSAFDAYMASLAREIVAAHRPGSNTLVIVNRVDRAQALFKALDKTDGKDIDRLLIHSRFRKEDRDTAQKHLKEQAPPAGRIVVATQAVEAGVDVTSAVLFTELAPWPSLVQRFGRCNRYGECGEAGASVYWIDIATDGKEADKTALPYETETLDRARTLLQGLNSVAPADLPAVEDSPAAAQVLRRKDLLELFNTEPDLSGFDVDVSPYIRDAIDTDVRLFWRDGALESPETQPLPERNELCPVSITAFRDFIVSRQKLFGGAGRSAFLVIDPITRVRKDKPVPWVPLDRPRPGLTVMVDAAAGGYDPKLGFDSSAKGRVPALPPADPEQHRPDTPDEDPDSRLRRFIPLTEHLAHVEAAAAALCTDVGEDPAGSGAAVVRAARWHDVGKAHAEFQARLTCGLEVQIPTDGPFAKSPITRFRYDRPDFRRYFRHELASALAFLAHGTAGPDDRDGDLVAYLIAAHHGKVRTAIRALPEEREPKEPGQRFARGIWEGETLPALDVAGKEQLPETTLSLAVMELGLGPHGPSWTERVQRLLADLGPFRLAWYEALVRLADWKASDKENAEPAGEATDA